MAIDTEARAVAQRFRSNVAAGRAQYPVDVQRAEHIQTAFPGIIDRLGITSVDQVLTKGDESPPALTVRATHPLHGAVVISVTMETLHLQLQRILADMGLSTSSLEAERDTSSGVRINWTMRQDGVSRDFRPESRGTSRGVSFEELVQLMPAIADLIRRYQDGLKGIAARNPELIPEHIPEVGNVFLAQVDAVVRRALVPHGFIDGYENYAGQKVNVAAELLIDLAKEAYATDVHHPATLLHGDPWQGSLYMEIGSGKSDTLRLDGLALFTGPSELDLAHFMTRVAESGEQVAALHTALREAGVSGTDTPKFLQLLAVGSLRRAGELQLFMREKLGLPDGAPCDPYSLTDQQHDVLKAEGLDPSEVNNRTTSFIDAALHYWKEAGHKVKSANRGAFEQSHDTTAAVVKGEPTAPKRLSWQDRKPKPQMP